ncbi:MAG TPA: magnesium transporter [Gemmatimonadales bacterium]|jgi:magnesium transporter
MSSSPPPATPEQLTPEFLYLLSGDAEDFAAAVQDLRAADIAEALNHLPAEAAARVVTALPFELAVQLFDEPELEHRGDIVAEMQVAVVGPLIDALSADQQVELYRELTPDARTHLLPFLHAATRDTLRTLMNYPATSAGGIMTTEFVSVPNTWTADAVKRYIAEVGEAKETVYAIYILDPADNTLQHVISLREVMMVPGHTVVSEIGDDRTPITVDPLVDREDAARLISKYNLLALPVIDDHRRMLGIVTVDDIIDALVSENTEDVQKLGGMEAIDEPYLQISFLEMLKKRAGWLAILFVGETLTAQAMGHFEAEIAAAPVLALFIPLIISSGGNSGSQSTSLIIRAMALNELSLRDWWRALVRDIPTGFSLGAMLGAIGFCRVLLWQYLSKSHYSLLGITLGWDYGPHYMLVAATVFAALIGVVLFGSVAGSMLPFVLRRFGLDPASASAPFVATLVDVTGLVIYFSVAYSILHGTLLR